jgi:hypothetical protein
MVTGVHTEQQHMRTHERGSGGHVPYVAAAGSGCRCHACEAVQAPAIKKHMQAHGMHTVP